MTDRRCMVCRESSSSEIDISISNEIKTSPKLTSQYMPLSGLSQFPFNSTSKNSTQNAPKLAFFSSKIGATRRLYFCPPAKNSGGAYAIAIGI